MGKEIKHTAFFNHNLILVETHTHLIKRKMSGNSIQQAAVSVVLLVGCQKKKPE